MKRRARQPSRAVIVTRVSTKGQEDNTSHETQLQACRRYCALNDMEIVDELTETKSGALYHFRAETQAAIAMIEENRADAVVFYDMTRYGRDSEFMHKILKRIIKGGGQLHITMLPLQYEPGGELTPESETMFGLMGSLSPAERKMIKRRLLNGKAKKTAQGIQVQRSQMPYGWTIVDKNAIIRGEHPPEMEGYYMPVPEQLQVVREMIFGAYAEGKSLNQICAALNAAQIQKTRKATGWLPYPVRYIIKNPLYCGRPASGRTQSYTDDDRQSEGKKSIVQRHTDLSEWNFWVTPNIKEHFAKPELRDHLVPESVWWECQKRLSENQKWQSGNPNNRFMLTYICLCPKCGKTMRGRSKSRGQGVASLRYYSCVSSPRHFRLEPTTTDCTTFWRAGPIEEMTVAGIEWLSASPTVVIVAEAAQRRADSRQLRMVPDETETAMARIQEIELREQAAIDAKIEAQILRQETSAYNAVLARLAGEKRLLQLQLDKATTTATAITTQVSTIRAALAAIVEELKDPAASTADKNVAIAAFVASVALVQGPEANVAVGVSIRLKSEPGHALIVHATATARGTRCRFIINDE